MCGRKACRVPINEDTTQLRTSTEQVKRMKVRALSFMGLALAGVVALTMETAAAQDMVRDQQQMHQLKQDNQDPSTELLQLGEDNENPQLLDTNDNLLEDVLTRRERRQMPRLSQDTCRGDWEFLCPSGKCIYRRFVCDGRNHCSDGADEEDCQNNTCGVEEFRCLSGQCISSRDLCNGWNDCSDGSDEEDCQNNTCYADEFRCLSGQCIYPGSVCDGRNDCSDGSDEEDCHDNTCGVEEFRCLSGKCIEKYRMCDGGRNDCLDGSDEEDCQNNTCSAGEFPCLSGQCLRAYQVCNGGNDCSDGSDEDDCHNHTCSAEEFVCPSGLCIYPTWLCDGEKDCPDEADEEDCQKTTSSSTPPEPTNTTPATTALATKFRSTTTGCGNVYSSNRGRIQHYTKEFQSCTWIIRPTERIKITIVKFEIDSKDDYSKGDYLYISDESELLRTYTGSLTDANFPSPYLTTTTTSLKMIFISDNGHSPYIGNELELHWEPAVDTFYQIPRGSDYEVRLNFSINPGPTGLEWSYGPNFMEMTNIIQIPSDDGNFATSWIDLQDNNYQAVLKIIGITQDDIETKFQLHATNEIGETRYRIRLSASLSPPVISNITATTVTVSWDCSVSPGENSSYVLLYRPRYTNSQDYREISGLFTNSYTITGLTTEYEIRVLVVNNMERGPPSEPSYVATSCGGEYNSSAGSIQHPLSGDRYNAREHCTWIIRAAGPIRITFNRFHTKKELYLDERDFLYIYDGLGNSSVEVGRLTGSLTDNVTFPRSITTKTNALLINFTAGYAQSTKDLGFEFSWEPAEVVLYVNPGERVRLECSTNAHYKFCTWKNDAHIIQVEDVHKGLYSGLERPNVTLGNECGIVISQSYTRDHGTWICNIYLPYSRDVMLAITKIVPVVTPTKVEVSPQELTANNAERIFIRCIVKSARPAAKIRWTLNGKNISSSAQVKETPNNSDDTFQTLSTLSHIVSLTENGQMLKCEVVHHSLVEPEFHSVPIRVFGFDPVQRLREIQIHYNISFNSNHEIHFKFTVSPRLTSMKWYYGTNFQERSNFILIPSETDKYSALFINLNNGSYVAILKIAYVTKEDIQNKLTLHVENGKSQANYRFMLSTDENPFECSVGFVMSYDAKHCYKIFSFHHKRNYTEAQKKCKDDGLMPVQLSDEDAADVRNMLLDEYGDGPVWLNSRGNNKSFVWTGTQNEIKNGSNLWWPNSTGDWVGTKQCLLLLVNGSNWKSHPGKPYRPFFCQRKLRTLCEGDPPKPKKTVLRTAAAKSLDEFCSGGWFFTSISSFECYVYLHDALRSREEAKGTCEEKGYLIAKPSSGDRAIAMRKYLLDRYGDGRVWLGARANGTHYLWDQDNTQLSWGSPLWEIGRPEGDFDDCWQSYVKCGRGTPDHCLTLRVTHSEWMIGPQHPYASEKCSTPQYALCQRKAGCPAGFFTINGSHQCFKLLQEKGVTMAEARSRCRDQGLHLAQPSHEFAVALFKYLFITYEIYDVWIGARLATPDSEVLWLVQDNTTPATAGNSSSSSIRGSGGGDDAPPSGIPRNSPLWRPRWGPGRKQWGDNPMLCVYMTRNSPDKPYAVGACHMNPLPLCQIFDPERE